jgi:dynactin 1
VDEQKTLIDDLEAMKELSDELEENHVETEKELMEEIEDIESVVREQLQLIASLQASSADYENTILQFRQLVQSLQA